MDMCSFTGGFRCAAHGGALGNKGNVVEDYDALSAGCVAGEAGRCASSAPTNATAALFRATMDI